ncbi:MAG: hypothetical protein LBJ24_06755 [Treponema sp.]|jgi:hypothetical protein|nr:hypothetical protein [Treponema sp.]
MKQFTALVLAAALFVLTLAVCDTGGGSGGSLLYAAGYYIDGSYAFPCYWKDGTQYNLPLPAGAVSGSVDAIAILGGSAYMAGVYNNGSAFVPCYWKDGTRHDLSLPAGFANGYALSAATGGAVSLAGYCEKADGTNAVCSWNAAGTVTQNAVLTVPAGATLRYVRAAAAEGTSIYAAGTYRKADNTDVTCYWKDGTRYDLDEGTLDGAWSIAVSGGVVYVAGHYDNSGTDTGCYWKDNGTVEKTGFSGAGFAEFITVSGGVVYAAGSNSSAVPCYWKDGTRYDLPLPAGALVGYASVAAASGGVVYAAGAYNDGAATVPCYWKDGTRYDLPLPAGITDGCVRSIAVVE